jgi:hypothetical protein
MSRIREYFELARLCYVQANGSSDPKARKAFQEIGDQYIKEAEEFSQTEIIQAVFPSDQKVR